MNDEQTRLAVEALKAAGCGVLAIHVQSRIEALEKDAERFIKLAAHMTFSLDGEYVTMDFSCPVDATKTHDVHEDWIEPRFTDSVRRTVDTAMQFEKGGV